MNKVVLHLGLWAILGGAALGCGPKETPAEAPPPATPGAGTAVTPATPTSDVPLLSPDECVAKGGETVGDPGDGSTRKNGCSGGRKLLGNVKTGIEGGICCAK